jgi:hypothetical protein
MDPTDPRFSGITGQGFSEIGVSLAEPGGSSSWMDPRDIKSSKVHVTVPSNFVRISEMDPEKSSKDGDPEKTNTSGKLAQEVAYLNTPNPGSFFLPGAPAKVDTLQKPKDPWASPEPLRSGDKVVGKGATIRFGGGTMHSGGLK